MTATPNTPALAETLPTDPRAATPGRDEARPEPGGTGKGSPGSGRPAPRVIGLDLSLTATGVAHADGTLDSIRTGPADHLADQRDRLRYIVHEVIQRTQAGLYEGPELAVIEGPSYNSSGAGTWDRAGLWWLVVDRLMYEAVRVAVVPPATLKRYATGRGNATKPDMRMALFQRAEIDERDDNRVDAAWLRLAGLDHLGHPPVELPKLHRDALQRVDWPEVAP